MNASKISLLEAEAGFFRGGEMALWLSVGTEDMSLALGTHVKQPTTALNFSARGFLGLWHLMTQHLFAYAQTHLPN